MPTSRKTVNEKKLRSRRVIFAKYIAFIATILLALATLSAGCIISSKPPEEAVIPPAVNLPIEQQRFADGITIEGISLGGLNLEGAKQHLDSKVPSSISQLTVGANDIFVKMDTSNLIISSDLDEILLQALKLGNTGTREERVIQREELFVTPKSYDITVNYDNSTMQEEFEKIAADLTREPVNGTATYNPDNPELFDFMDGSVGQKVLPEAVKAAFEEYVNSGRLTGVIYVDFEEVEPQVTKEEVMANNKLISTTTSSFKKGTYSKANRVFNITKASENISGIVLQPGDEFSFNTVVGPRTAATGFKAAGAIADGISVDEIGGGICQVSSTLFNSVLKADLEIVKRSPHSWPLSYIPAGQDATVSMGGPDFIFKNNKDTPVIVVAKVDDVEKEVIIEIYGKPLPDGIRIELESSKIETVKEPPAQYNTVASMKPGTKKVIRPGRSGSRYETYILRYKGEELVERVLGYKSNYRAIAAIVEIGPVDTTPGGGTSTPNIPSEGDDFVPDEDFASDISIPDESEDVVILE